MHTYDVPRRQSYQPIPSARSAQDYPSGPSATPIYDALYAEYGKSFRSRPGDRSGEEELNFTAFGTSPYGGSNAYGPHGSGSGSSSYSAYSAGAFSARNGGQGNQGGGQPSAWQRVGQLDAQQGQTATTTAVWQTGGRQQHYTGMTHIPAALPPGPRRDL